MITLPAGVVPASASPMLLDYGLFIRPSTGAPPSRIDKPGSRWGAEIVLPPLDVATANVVLSRLTTGRTTPLRVDWPLMGVSQAVGGAPVVDGVGPGGTTLPVRGLTPGAAIAEGWWINLTDVSGNIYLHQVRSSVIADGAGKATLSIFPMIRAVFADASAVAISAPKVEGIVTSDHKWPMTPDRLVPISFTIEEAN